MKRSFYELLDVPPDADQAQIDFAYVRATIELDADKNLRGTAAAAASRNLIREGRAILADPALRARYDAKLAAERSGVKLLFGPEIASPQRRVRVQGVILAALAVVLGTVVYAQLSQKMDAVRLEHEQAVARKQHEQNQPVILKATRTDRPGGVVGADKRR